MTNGPLHRFFAADHRRLDALLRRSVSVPGQVDLVPFGEFRAGILKHIGMEEKVLFPAARHAREAPLVLAARLRVDHGAIAALLVPTPTPALVAEILSVLGPHNRREEEPGGIYDAGDEAVGEAEAERMDGLVPAARQQRHGAICDSPSRTGRPAGERVGDR